MTDRIVEVSSPARLSVRDCQLVIVREGGEEATTPLSELAVLLIAHPRVTLTQAVLSRVALEGGSVVTCDDKFLPASMLLPVQAHFIQGERFARQIEMSLALRKRLWQQIIRAKIRVQGNLLRELCGSDAGLVPMSNRVRSGDAGNLESQAARQYWPRVFNNPKFRRGSEGPDQNRHLDYGYTVLRAATARALCAAGLHPSIGLRHHNRYDVFSLASDVMEPFRPAVDRRVHQWIRGHDPTADFDRQARGWMLGLLTERYWVEGEQRTLFNALARTCNALAGVITKEGDALLLPEELPLCGE
jgi:CRISPR-associated protein Cas1